MDLLGSKVKLVRELAKREEERKRFRLIKSRWMWFCIGVVVGIIVRSIL